MPLFSNLISAAAGFGLGVYVHKNCHFERVEYVELKSFERFTGPIYLPTRWKTPDELKKTS